MKTISAYTNMNRLLSFFAAVILFGAQTLQAQWIPTNGPNGGAITCFAANGADLFAGTMYFGGGVHLSSDNGANWTALNTGLTDTFVLSLVVHASNLFAGTLGGVFRSTNNGANWTSANTGLPSSNGFPSNSVLSFASIGSNLYAGTGSHGVYLSSNNGTSWTAVSTGLPQFADVRALAVNGPLLFAGTHGDGVFLSTNNGTSWTAVNIGLTNTSVLSLAVNGPNLFAGTDGGGVFLSTNNGTTWTAVNTGLTNTYVVRSLVVRGSSLFAGVYERGVFLSTNNGTSWNNVNNGLLRYEILSLAVNNSNLFVGINGSGVWRRPLTEMVTGVEDDFSKAPVGFALEQNYPNPFNPSTQITFALPSAQKVTLKVFDLAGQGVATLLNNERKPAGKHELTFDAGNLPSGVYFYQLRTGEFWETKKMLLVR